MKKDTTVLDLIGNTPMVKLKKLVLLDKVNLYAKLEWYNVGGSLKDRMAKYLIEYAEAAGELTREKTILEATSGNTGIALSMIAAVKGYRITVTMPESVSVERRKIIKAYGANLVLSSAEKGTGGAVELKNYLLQKNPEKYVDIDQFKDPANILAHYQTTGKEILEQTEGKVDTIVAGVGTGGTGVGTSLCVKEHNPDIEVIGVLPAPNAHIQGLRHPEEPYPTELFKEGSFDEIIEVSEEKLPEIYTVAQKAAREEGLLVGMSAAAVLYVIVEKIKKLEKKKTFVAILHDDGTKYLSTSLFNENSENQDL